MNNIHFPTFFYFLQLLKPLILLDFLELAFLSCLFNVIFFFLSIIATSYVKYNNFLPKNMLYCYILTFFSHNQTLFCTKKESGNLFFYSDSISFFCSCFIQPLCSASLSQHSNCHCKNCSNSYN